jgi:hypothetical protein
VVRSKIEKARRKPGFFFLAPRMEGHGRVMDKPISVATKTRSEDTKKSRRNGISV